MKKPPEGGFAFSALQLQDLEVVAQTYTEGAGFSTVNTQEISGVVIACIGCAAFAQ